MRYLIFSLLLLAFTVIFGCDSSEHFILKNATIINFDSGKTEIVNISVSDGVIDKITTDTLKGYNSIDLRGGLVISPLWDMHAHLHENIESKKDSFKNHGVLGIRDMGIFKTNDSTFFKELDINMSEGADYKIFPVGYIYNGSNCEVEEHIAVKTKFDLVEAITKIKAANLKFFKIHNCFPNKLLSDLDELCRENEIKIVGHIPEGISPLNFTKHQISSIEHIDSFLRGLFGQEDPVTSFAEAIEILDGKYLDSLAIHMKTNNTYLTPTLVTYENFVKSFPEDQQEAGMAVLKRLQDYTKRFWESGVQLLAGSDYPLGELKAGKSLIRELELLVAAGIPVNEVLKIATQNPLEYLEVENWEIKEGSPAKFLIIPNNSNIIRSLKEDEVVYFDGTEASIKGLFHY